jgi:hypothetical protein
VKSAPARESGKRDGGYSTAPGGLLEGVHGVRHLARPWQVLDTTELDPLDVADDGHP